MRKEDGKFKYLVCSQRDVDWGITVNTVGSALIEPGYAAYPPKKGHPDAFYFTPSRGRVLDSYQLLYITRGRGQFFTSPDKSMPVKEGDMIALQPQRWHSYFPDKRTGWQEYWIGFEGVNIDSRFENGFLRRDQAVYHLGVHAGIVALYNQAVLVAMQEKAAYQQYLAGIANLILGMTMYYAQNSSFDDHTALQIDKAKAIMQENLFGEISPEDVARMVNMSYSWFRKTFKDYTGLAPAHYITRLKVEHAKHLLSTTDRTVKEIAYELNFGELSYFSQVFRRATGLTPVEYRSRFIVGN